MIEKHISIDIEQFGNKVRDALKETKEISVFQNFSEIDDLSIVDSVMVYATVVCVYVERDESIFPSHYATLLKAVYDIFSEHPKCKDILSLENNIVAVIDSPFKTDIDNALDSVGKINTLFNLANKIREKKKQQAIKRGIGMNYGKVLLVKTAQPENLVVGWDGEALSSVIKLSKSAVERAKVHASYTIFNNLKEDYQKLFSKVTFEDYYEANPVNIAMNKWIIANV